MGELDGKHDRNQRGHANDMHGCPTNLSLALKCLSSFLGPQKYRSLSTRECAGMESSCSESKHCRWWVGSLDHGVHGLF